ncbi:hypothetical protein SAY86_030535 [Trapa natans]|uniref:Lipoxygenase n=1 Tax=Trapa natans TaxID=22666 RepID=A0AAN7M5B0_TRANT|nr:hypothetical protein SAY86_030535 [Trapa natans]
MRAICCVSGGLSKKMTIEQAGDDGRRKEKIKGTVKLMKKNVLDMTDVKASIFDRIHELLGRGVRMQLISSDRLDPANHTKGKLGKPAHLEKWITKITSLTAGETDFGITFDWDESMGIPGALLVRNHHHSQIFLKSVTLDYVPGHDGPIMFVCNSWVYPTRRYKYDRVFFSNKTYLPHQTPVPLRPYRQQELINLRGNGSNQKLKEWDRVYDYAYYNDLGNPDRGPDYVRPVLGGSEEYPYPRRGKTGRKPSKTDPHSESRLNPLLSLNIYVPRDERFSYIKYSDFLAYALKSVGQVLTTEVWSFLDNEFDTFKDVLSLYEGGIKLPDGPKVQKLKASIPWEMLKELARDDGERLLKFPTPDVIKVDKTAWRTDEEFAREMLAGVNPVVISSLLEFPPKSRLDPKEYGDQNSSIRAELIEMNMNGLTIDQAIGCNRMFILDHHDVIMPYLRQINSTKTKMYATRTILLLQDDGTLKPLAIELSLPHPQGDRHGAVSKVFTPAEEGVQGTVWQLAKAYVSVNDSGYHQLISHWLNTHAVIEPFVIATNRQLSVLHPIYKLLHPHFRDTMNINALARQILINAGGVLENTVFPAKFAMEMSSVVYKNWVFTEQTLPADLVKRGMAILDPSSPHGLRLVIEDYPYAVDGLEIWSAIETWVQDYCAFYYTTDEMVHEDSELQSWWTEIRNVGHGDKKKESWWPEMHTRAELTQTCTTIIWVASALHAAVNFGQYPYAGYLPNRPTLSRRFMPEPGTAEYAELENDPDRAFLKTITPQLQTLLGVALIEILSRHSTDEFYLGQRDDDPHHWTSDHEPKEAFQRFGNRLVQIENRILEMNRDNRWKNRVGAVQVPYTLLYPNTSDYSRVGGLTGKGIPNSVSI